MKMKSTVENAIITLENKSMPNQMMKSGARATRGRL